jgi:diguanylate cyclase (GGDEF)-like protein
VPYEKREACRHVGQILSHAIEAREEAETYRAAANLGEAREAVLHALRSVDDPVGVLLSQCRAFQDVVPSHGVAVSTKEELRTAGHTPTQEQVEQLTAWLRQRLSASDGFVTERLSDEYPLASEFTSAGSGLLSISVPADEPVILMWFRAEQIEEIRWAGNPHEALEPGSTPGALNPRRSFATWSETVRGRSRPWAAVEIASAQSIRPRLASILQRQKIRELNVLLQEANARLSAQATTDGLTGIPNRRAFDERLEHEWARASRHERSLALLVLDVDYFKQYNDHFGHLAGDECLKQIAQVLSRERRTSDLAARFGGEEFCILLPDTDLQGASRVAEAIRSSISELGVEHPKSQIGHLTVSIGVIAAVPASGHSPRDLLQSADEALYRAKAGGRNRVERALLETSSA